MLDHSYTDADRDAAIEALAEPQRLREAHDLVLRSAPALQRVLAAALEDGGWFDQAHEQAIREATAPEGVEERLRAVRTLLADETRLGMMVGVAVGFQLARELARAPGAVGQPTEQED
ncbi:MAG TPA: hypothetical protein VIX82_14645 [Solirubrobacteraceae bacterium]